MDREEDEVAELFGDFGGDADGTDHCNDSVSPTSGGTDHVIDGIDIVSPTGDGTDHVIDGDGGIDGGNADLFASEEEDNVPLTQLQLNASLASGQSATLAFHLCQIQCNRMHTYTDTRARMNARTLLYAFAGLFVAEFFRTGRG